MVEIRASELRKGDTFEEAGMEPIKITSTRMHGDTVLVKGRVQDTPPYGIETSLDRDDCVTLLDRKKGTS